MDLRKSFFLACICFTMAAPALSRAQKLSSITISTDRIAGGGSTSAIIELSGKAPRGGLSVKLASNTNSVVLPTQIVVSAGKESATLQITTKHVGAQVSAEITAEVTASSASANLIIDDVNLTALALYNSSIVGGSPVSGDLALVGPPGTTETNMLVTFSSSDPTAVQVPTSLVVTKLAQPQNFNVTTAPVAKKTFVKVTATFEGMSLTQTMTVLPPTLISLSPTPGIVVGGSSSSLFIRLDAKAPPGGWMVKLKSNELSATVPSTLTIPEGKTTAVVVIKTKVVKLQTLSTISAVDPIGNKQEAPFVVEIPSSLALSAWPKYLGNAQNTSLGSSSAAVGVQFWHSKPDVYGVGPATSSSMAIAVDGSLYAGGDDGKIYALKPDGSVKWRIATSGAIKGSPAIGADGTVYIGSADGKFYAVRPNGSIKWTFKTGAGIQTSPTVGPDGTIYVVSDDGFLYALTSAGTKKWASEIIRFTTSSPAVGQDGTIYVGCFDSNLYAISPTGKLKWLFSCQQPVVASPIVGPDGVVYVGGTDGEFRAITPAGKLKWSLFMHSTISNAAAIGPDGRVCLALDNGVMTEIAPDGDDSWNTILGSPIKSAPTICPDGTVFVGCTDGYIYSFAPGLVYKWRFPAFSGAVPVAITASPAIGADGTLFIGNQGFWAIK